MGSHICIVSLSGQLVSLLATNNTLAEMNRLLVVIFVSATIMFSSSNGEDDLEEVPYTVLNATETYQLRNYPSARFACVRTEMDAPVGDSSSTQGFLSALQQMVSMFQGMRDRPESKMFMKLFKYISGANQEGQEIPMTRPVRTHYKPMAGNMEEQVMCFYVPSAWGPKTLHNQLRVLVSSSKRHQQCKF